MINFEDVKMLKSGLGSRSARSRMIWPELELFHFFFRSGSRSTLKNLNGSGAGVEAGIN